MMKMARFFCELAKMAARDGKHEDLTMHVQATIVFGRSVTFAIQKHFSHQPGFDEWYAEKQDCLRKNIVARFLLESRNIILKEGPIPMFKETNIAIHDSVTMVDSVYVKVVRGTPWYRRSARILYEDITRRLRQCLAHLALRISTTPAPATIEPKATIDERYHFDSPELVHRSAFEVLDDYLGLMATLVSEAQTAFPDESA